ncbi:hypothetical protein NXS19_004758 [Fusarium pseudograminearum]|nr:hypothetical protein NXS19_004758 [Fusarium pseudograminearum]
MDEPAPLRWSSALPVVNPSTISSKNLRGDKILLPQSALEQLLAAARSLPSTTTTRSDPWSAHSDADSAQQLPNPLTFRLVNPKNKNAVFAGIREFSATEGTMGLSPWLTEALGIQENEYASLKEVIDLEQDPAQLDGIQIKVEARQLPKGTYVRFRPLEAGYNPDDWKALLERQLRENFTTLSKGSMIAVKGAHGEEFKLLVDKVAPEGDGICVVDTDLEVDIEALDEEQARETLRRIISKQGGPTGSSTGGEIDVWKAVDGQVLEGGYVHYMLPSWNKSQPLAIELSTDEEDYALDLFVTPNSPRQRGQPREGVHVFGDFSPTINGVKRIVISPTNVELEGAEQIAISVHAYRHPDAMDGPEKTLQYTLRAKVDLPDEQSAPNGASNGTNEEHSPDEEQCSNCVTVHTQTNNDAS